MTSNCVENWDDWENIDTPDLIINLEETIKNRERELKLLEERKKMEESDLALAEDLFNKNEDTILSIKDLEPVKFIKNDRSNEIKKLQEQKKYEMQEKQKRQSQKQKEMKKQHQRLKDIYGNSDIDEYDEMYCDIEDKFI